MGPWTFMVYNLTDSVGMATDGNKHQVDYQV